MKRILIHLLVAIALIASVSGQTTVAVRLVHKHTDALARRAQSGHVAEVVGYDVVVSTNDATTNSYWIAKRSIISGDDITNVTWQTGLSNCIVRLALSRNGRERVAWATRNGDERGGVFVGGSLRGITTLRSDVQLLLTNVLTEGEAKEVQECITRKAEQSTAPVPPAPRTGPSDGAR